MRRTLVAITVLHLTACGEPPPALQVAGVAFAEEELLGLTPGRREALAELAAFGAAVAEGRADALGRPLVERWRRERLAELLAAQGRLDSLDIGEDALRASYQTDPDFELTVRHLLVFSERFETEATRAQAKEKAERALARIRAGEDLGAVAAEVSEEPGAESREGLLQPGRQGSWVPEFWNAALALPVGAVSPVVETQYGFHVLRLEARDTVPFEEARNRVILAAAAMLGAREAPAPAEVQVTLEPVEPTVLLEGSLPDGETAGRWEGGTLTVGALRDHLATLEHHVYQDLGSGRRPLDSAAAIAAGWLETERRARERGLAVGAAHEAETLRRWSDLWSAWAQTLGFDEGVATSTVKEAALAALTATGQNAGLARDALHARSPLIRRVYDLGAPPPPP